MPESRSEVSPSNPAGFVPAEPILDSLPGLVAFVGSDLRYRFMSAGYERWFGGSRSEMIGRHMRDIVGESAFARLHPHVETALSGRTAEFETEVEYKDGRRLYIRATYTPHFDAAGQVIGFALYVEDIGHRVEAERARRRGAVLESVTTALASSLEYEPTLQQLTDVVVSEGLADWSVVTVFEREDVLVPVAMSTSDIRFQARLPELLRLYRPQPTATRGMARVIRTAEPEFVPAVDEAFIRGLAVTEDQMNVLWQLKPVSYMAVPLAARGHVLGALGFVTTERSGRRYDDDQLALARDIGWRAGLVLDNVRLYQRARTAEARLRLILESARDYAILALDTGGRVVDWSEGARNVFGYEAHEIVGQDASILFIPEERALGVPQAETAQAAETARVENDRWHLRKDGTRFFASGITTSIRDEAGTLRGFVKVARDFTERKRAEDERKELLKQAEEARAAAEAASRLKDEFLAMVSHELRTPLTAIFGWAHMLKQERLDRETTAKAVDTIIRNAATQGRLLNDLFDMARIVSGQLRLDIQECELIPVIDAAIETVRLAAEAKGIRFERSLDPEAEPILGDPTRMQQVVWNLLSNAIKFTPAGGRVQVRLERAEPNVRIVVEDTGHGIASDFLPFVFGRFRRGARDEGARMGLGLGLAIVKHLVELHGGTVEARSEGEGRGSTFIVSVPWWNPKRLDGVGTDAESPAVLDLRGMRILLVEDDADTRELLLTMLRHFNASVVAVGSAAEALAAIEERPPDVLVSDIHLPPADSYELIRAVRALPLERGGGVPAIALTALARQEDHRRALEAGYQVHVPKPVTPAKLSAVLGFLLRQSPRS